MAVTKEQLIKQWIQYLKSNQIVELQPDSTGKLVYRKDPTEDDLFQFLQKTFTDEEIKRAFTNARKSRSTQVKKVPEGLENPDDNPCWKGYHPVGTKTKNGKTVPNCVPNAKESIEEDFTDLQKPVDEKFVSYVFSSIIRLQATDLKKQEQEALEQKKQAVLGKVHSIIQKMTPTQRQALLAALKAPATNESIVSETAGAKLDATVLIQNWKNNNYPITTEGFKDYLSRVGYSLKDIKNTMASHFKPKEPSPETEEPDNSAAIAKIVKVTKELGITQEVIDLLEKNFRVKEDSFDYMQVKSMLESISKLDRVDHLRLIEKRNLGKNKKR